MKTPDLTETIFHSLCELGHAPGSVTPSTRLDELGIDSLETVELSATVCRQLGLPSHVAADVRNVCTVAELAGRIESLLAQTGSVAGTRESP